MRRSLRVLAGVLVLMGLAAGLSTSSWGLTSAQQIVVNIGAPLSGAEVGESAKTISYYMNTPGQKLGYGETILNFSNYTSSYRQIIVAQTDLRPDQIPRKMLDAIVPGDDAAIVDMTDRIDFVTNQASIATGPEPLAGTASLHIYLKPGTRYLIFDKLGGYKHGFAVVLRTPPSRS